VVDVVEDPDAAAAAGHCQHEAIFGDGESDFGQVGAEATEGMELFIWLGKRGFGSGR
jgi:hypothetical protein